MGKFGRFVTMTAVAAATGAGVYYYLNKSQETKKDIVDGDIVDGAADAKSSESVADFFKEKRDAIMSSREYVSLSKNLSETKNALVKTVTEAAEMIKEKAAEAKDGVGVVSDENKDKAEDFEFDSFKDDEATDETAEEKAAEIAGEIRDGAQNLADELIDEYKGE